jgi:hypothetical protein
MTTPVASLNYDPAADGSFGGWDNFGRVVQQTWKDPAAGLPRCGFRAAVISARSGVFVLLAPQPPPVVDGTPVYSAQARFCHLASKG